MLQWTCQMLNRISPLARSGSSVDNVVVHYFNVIRHPQILVLLKKSEKITETFSWQRHCVPNPVSSFSIHKKYFTFCLKIGDLFEVEENQVWTSVFVEVQQKRPNSIHRIEWRANFRLQYLYSRIGNKRFCSKWCTNFKTELCYWPPDKVIRHLCKIQCCQLFHVESYWFHWSAFLEKMSWQHWWISFFFIRVTLENSTSSAGFQWRYGYHMKEFCDKLTDPFYPKKLGMLFFRYIEPYIHRIG